MEKKKLNLETILENAPEEIDIPDYGTALVKFPETKDKLEAKREAIRLTEGLPEEDMLNELTRILALKMLVDPPISLNDYLKSNDTKMSIILDNVYMWYNLKVKELNEKRQEQVKNFLTQMKAH